MIMIVIVMNKKLGYFLNCMSVIYEFKKKNVWFCLFLNEGEGYFKIFLLYKNSFIFFKLKVVVLVLF